MAHLYVCDMTRDMAQVEYVTSQMGIRHVTRDMAHSYVCDTTHENLFDMTHSYVWIQICGIKCVRHDSFICVLCEMICVTWLIYVSVT